MSVISTLKKGTGRVKIEQEKLLVSRSAMLLTVVLFAAHAVEDVASGAFLKWPVPPEYIFLKHSLLAIMLIGLSFSFISQRVKNFFNKLNLWMYLVIFYLIALSTFAEGVDLQNQGMMLIVSVLAYVGYLKGAEFFIYTVLTNFLLVPGYLIWNAYYGDTSFFVMHLVTTVGLLAIRLLRARSEELVVEVDLFFEEIFNNLRDAVFLVTPHELNVVFDNHAANRIFGTNTKSVLELVAKESYGTFMTAIKMIYRFRAGWEGEVRFTDKDGRTFDSLVTLSYFIVSDEEMLFIKIADISKLKNAQLQLKDALSDVQEKNSQLENSKKAIMNILQDVVTERSDAVTKERKLSAVLRSIVEGVLVIDKDHKIYMFNDAAVKMLGCKPEDLNEHEYTEIVHFEVEKKKPEDPTVVMDLIGEVYNGEQPRQFLNLMLKQQNGNLLPVSASTSPVLDDQGAVDRVVLVFRDDTEQRKIDRMRTEFVSVASHQLRTPLTSIKWYTELLGDQAANPNLTPEQLQFIKEINNGNDRMIDLVDDLLNVSRIEAGRNFMVKLAEMDIVKLIYDVIGEQKIIAEKNGIQLVPIDNGITSLMINFDWQKIRQVIMNILSNAIKYSPANASLEIIWRKDADNFYLDIQDHGIGIPKADQERVFEKYFRASNAVSKQTEGTGLGTYISRTIARAHGGDVTFVSEENKGTTFTLRLPLVISVPKEAEALAAETNIS